MLPDRKPWRVVPVINIMGICNNNILARNRSNEKNTQKNNVEKLSVYNMRKTNLFFVEYSLSHCVPSTIIPTHRFLLKTRKISLTERK
jgi:hypothetical protein